MIGKQKHHPQQPTETRKVKQMTWSLLAILFFKVLLTPLKFMGYEFSSWRFGENGFLFLGDLDFVLSIVLGQFG